MVFPKKLADEQEAHVGIPVVVEVGAVDVHVAQIVVPVEVEIAELAHYVRYAVYFTAL